MPPVCYATENRVIKPAIRAERRADCARIRDLLETFSIDLTLAQARALWEACAMRQGLEWLEPKLEIAIFVEGAALTLQEQERKKQLNREAA